MLHLLVLINAMAMRQGYKVMQQRAQLSRISQLQRHFGTKTEKKAGKDGPTAVMFMNMGGPGNQGEVRDFLHRLFVRISLLDTTNLTPLIPVNSQMEISFPLDGFRGSLRASLLDSEHQKSRNNMQRLAVALLFANGLNCKHRRLAGS